MIGGFRTDLSITCMIDGNFGNVSAGVLFSKVAYQEGLNGVNRQPSNGQRINRQLSNTEYFYRQPSNERTKISRQISQQPRSQGLFLNFGAGSYPQAREKALGTRLISQISLNDRDLQVMLSINDCFSISKKYILVLVSLE